MAIRQLADEANTLWIGLLHSHRSFAMTLR